MKTLQSTKKVLELQSEFSTVTEYKVRIQQSIVLVHSSNEQFD